MKTLNADQLVAFEACARLLHFSAAASELHISQPALSHRIRKLEDDVGHILFTRNHRQVELTAAGLQLHRFIQTRQSLERLFLSAFLPSDQGHSEHAVPLRIAAFSSTAHSLLCEPLAELTRSFPYLRVDLRIQETAQLIEEFEQSRVGYILLDRALDHPGWRAESLGHETNVLVASRTHDPGAIYLDHDARDTYTQMYLGWDSALELKRHFVGSVSCLIEGAAAGLGRAVVPLHLIKGDKRLRIINPKKHLKVPVVLHHHELTATLPFHDLFVKTLRKTADRVLGRANKQ